MRPAKAGADAGSLPAWWQPLLRRVESAGPNVFSRLRIPAEGGRPAAVLILLGEDAHKAMLGEDAHKAMLGEDAHKAMLGEDAHKAMLGEDAHGASGPDVLLLQRAADMRNHAGQPAFPGGAADPGDAGPGATALREATEEVGLDPDSVEVLATLPPLWIPVSGFVVRPVLAWWRAPHPVYPCQPAEVARVTRVPVAELVDPANRLRVRHPSGFVGPAFLVRGMLVWGFTAGVLSALLDLAGWSRPWPEDAEPVALPIAGDRPVP